METKNLRWDGTALPPPSMKMGGGHEHSCPPPYIRPGTAPDTQTELLRLKSGSSLVHQTGLDQPDINAINLRLKCTCGTDELLIRG